MKYKIRLALNNIFTVLTALSVVAMVLVLIAILGPMIIRGSSAVFFTSTVEFREMQLDVYKRGNEKEIKEQLAKAYSYREHIYEKIDSFRKGLDTDAFANRAKDIYRQFKRELLDAGIQGAEYREKRTFAKQIRKDLETAFDSKNKQEVMKLLSGLDKYKTDEKIANTCASDFFQLADEFRTIIKDFDLSKRRKRHRI